MFFFDIKSFNFFLNQTSYKQKTKKAIYREKLVELENKRIRPKKSEVLRLCSSTKKSKKILNWTSSIKGKKQFKDKLYKTIDWYIENKNLIKINSKKYHI